MNYEHITFESRPNLMDEIISTPRSTESSIIINNFDSSFERNDQNENQTKNFMINNLQYDISEIPKETVKEKITFDKVKIEELSTSLMRNYSQFQISQSEAFLSRMENDLRRRQDRTKQIDKFVEEQKMKLSEKENIKTYNRLLTEIDTKTLAKEQLNYMKEIISKQIFLSNEALKVNKEYQWNDIYIDQFNKYTEDKSKHAKEKKEEQRLLRNQKKVDERNNANHKITKNSKTFYSSPSSLSIACNKPKIPLSIKSSLSYINNDKKKNKSLNKNFSNNQSDINVNSGNFPKVNNSNNSFHRLNNNQNRSSKASLRKTSNKHKFAKKINQYQPHLGLSKSQNNLIKDLKFSQSQIELYQANMSLNKQNNTSNKNVLELCNSKELKKNNLIPKQSLRKYKPHNTNIRNMNIITPVKKKKSHQSKNNYCTKSATSYKLIDYFFDQNLNEQSRKLKYK